MRKTKGVYIRKRMWYYDFTRYGKRYRAPASVDKRVAEQIYRDTLVKIDKQQKGLQVDVTIKKLIEEYLEYSSSNKKPNTYRKDLYSLKLFSEKVNINEKLTSILHTIHRSMDKYKTDLLNEAKKSPFTVNNYIIPIKAMLNMAVKWNYITLNPLKGFKKAATPKNPRSRFFSDNEVKMMLEASQGQLYVIINILLYTGLRIGELLFMEWTDIDLNKNILTVRNKDVWTPKDYEIRDIPIHPKMLPILLEIKDKKGFIIDKSSGDRKKDMLYRDTVKGKIYKFYFKRFKRLLESIGLVEKGIGFHTLRHTFASKCVMNGVDFVTISKILGHSTIKTTMTYAHLAPKHLKDSISSLHY